MLLHRLMPAASIIVGIQTVLAAGSTSTELVAIEAGKADPEGQLTAIPALPAPEDEFEGESAAHAEAGAQVITRHPRRADLPVDSRPLPSVAVYGQLLSRSTKGSA